MITAVVAVRKGSQRVPKKNIKPFGDSNLLEMKLNILKSVNKLDEIIVNTDCDEMAQISRNHGVKVQIRDEYFASNECTNSEFHGHIAENTKADVIFLAPVCSPFVSVASHNKGIEYFLENSFDSVTSVKEVKNHLWLNGKPLNYDLADVPNSQDLPDVVKLNYGITIVEKKIMAQERRVVGNHPGFIKLNDIESIDIDTPLDWTVAEAVYNQISANS